MLEKLFGSRLRAKVIGWLFTHTDQRFFVRQITSLLKEGFLIWVYLGQPGKDTKSIIGRIRNARFLRKCITLLLKQPGFAMY